MARAFRAAAVAMLVVQEHGQLRPQLAVVRRHGLFEQAALQRIGQMAPILTTASPSARENCSEVSGQTSLGPTS